MPTTIAGTALAKWLLDLACKGPGWPRVLLSEFAGALGDKGVTEVARLVEEGCSNRRLGVLDVGVFAAGSQGAAGGGIWRP